MLGKDLGATFVWAEPHWHGDRVPVPMAERRPLEEEEEGLPRP